MPAIIEAPKPSAPPTPRTPPDSKPFGNHHNPPSRQPVQMPQGNPAGKPLVAPQMLPLLVASDLIERSTRTFKCPKGERIEVGKDNEQDSNDGKKLRRQRPCQGGEPEVTYETKREKIGRFKIGKFVSKVRGDFITRKDVISKTKIEAKRAGYDVTKKGIDCYSKLDKARGVAEKIEDYLGRKDSCFYQVWIETKKRKCHCPDGSKCRSTVRT